MSPEIKDKIILVTGASRGIGRALGKALAAEGANVILTARTEDSLAEVKEEILSGGGNAEYITADFGNKDDIRKLFGKIKKEYGNLDVLVNNAGILLIGDLVDFPMDDLDRMIRINLMATYLCCQLALKMMIPAKSGYIINISSVMGIKGYPNQSAYAASKHGIVGMTKALAPEVQKHGIRVSLIHPGGVDTDLIKDVRPDLDTSVLMKTDDIAKTVIYLLSLSENAMVDEIYIRRAAGTPF